MSARQDPISWARDFSPVLQSLGATYSEPFAGLTVAVCSSITTNTGVLIETLRAAGAERVLFTSAGPKYNDPAVIRMLDDADGIEGYVSPGMSQAELDDACGALLAEGPDLLLDDGCVLTAAAHADHPDVAADIIGAAEQTTVGITRLRVLEEEGLLAYPVYAVNDTPMKRSFDNVHGTGESVLTAIAATTNTMLSGSTVVVAGYGYCGRGVARKAHGVGADTVVTEVDPRRALQAHMDGHRVLSLHEAAPVGDYFIAATGSVDVFRREHFQAMGDGAIIASAGTAAEIAVDDLDALATRTGKPRDGVTRYQLPDGRRLNLLADGYVVNLAAPGSDGHPEQIIDLTFAMMFEAARELVDGDRALDPGLYPVPDRLDRAVAERGMETLGLSLDVPTDRQREYAADWKHEDARK